MAPLSRLEINFRRLLKQCEEMVSQKESSNWRFEKYVAALEEKLEELKKINTCQPNKETLAEYTKKVELLKGIVVAEKLPPSSDKVIVNHLLSPGHSCTGTQTREIYLQTKSRYSQEMRQELLGTKTENGSPGNNGLRQRRSTSGSLPSEDLDAVLRYHNSMQEKMADEMVSLVQNLKQNSLLAGHIIRKDTETLERASQLAEQNYGQLKAETVRLETHVKRSCNWWVWMMVGLVCLTFLWMVLFIRLFPKR